MPNYTVQDVVTACKALALTRKITRQPPYSWAEDPYGHGGVFGRAWMIVLHNHIIDALEPFLPGITREELTELRVQVRKNRKEGKRADSRRS